MFRKKKVRVWALLGSLAVQLVIPETGKTGSGLVLAPGPKVELHLELNESPDADKV